MVDFETNFRSTKGLPFIEGGTEYRAFFRWNSGDSTRLRIRFLDGIASPRQGLRIDCPENIVDGKRRSRSLAFWKDACPSDFTVRFAPHVDICVRNLWDVGDGVEHSWHGGGAMRVELAEGVLRIHANSTLLNDACEDLVAELSWVPGETEQPKP